jgi:uncharacterized OB-fold protein
MTADGALVAAASALLGNIPVEEEGVATFEGLAFQRCHSCGYVRYPPASCCPECLSGEYSWERDSGLGALWSFCVYHRAYDPAFKDALPYNVALIELDSGPRIVSNVLGVAHGDLRVGMRLIGSPREIAPGRRLVYFEPVIEEEPT